MSLDSLTRSKRLSLLFIISRVGLSGASSMVVDILAFGASLYVLLLLTYNSFPLTAFSAAFALLLAFLSRSRILELFKISKL